MGKNKFHCVDNGGKTPLCGNKKVDEAMFYYTDQIFNIDKSWNSLKRKCSICDLILKKRIDKDILEFVRNTIDEDIEYSEGSFEYIFNDKTCRTWGWISPLTYKDSVGRVYKIIWLIGSSDKNIKAIKIFDYVSYEEYKEKYI